MSNREYISTYTETTQTQNKYLQTVQTIDPGRESNLQLPQLYYFNYNKLHR